MTTPPSQTTDLIERLEKLTGPDRDMDGEIAKLRGWTFQKMKGDSRPYWRQPGVTTYYMRESSGPPAYTASMDAALQLGRTVAEKRAILGAVYENLGEPLYPLGRCIIFGVTEALKARMGDDNEQ